MCCCCVDSTVAAPCGWLRKTEFFSITLEDYDIDKEEVFLDFNKADTAKSRALPFLRLKVEPEAAAAMKRCKEFWTTAPYNKRDGAAPLDGQNHNSHFLAPVAGQVERVLERGVAQPSTWHRRESSGSMDFDRT